MNGMGGENHEVALIARPDVAAILVGVEEGTHALHNKLDPATAEEESYHKSKVRDIENALDVEYVGLMTRIAFVNAHKKRYGISYKTKHNLHEQLQLAAQVRIDRGQPVPPPVVERILPSHVLNNRYLKM